MDINTPSSWKQHEFEAFILLIAASVDLEVQPEEKQPIRDKAGDSWNDVINAFRSMNDAERIEVVIKHRDQFLTTPDEHARIKKEVHQLFVADDNYTDIEHGVESILKRML